MSESDPLLSLRTQITTLIQDELRLTEPLPEGDLSESLDSVQRLSLVVAIEDHFEICFDDDDDQQAQTLEDIVRLVAKRLERA